MHNFLYQALNKDVIKVFMIKTKYKPDQFNTNRKSLHLSFSHLRKFHDAILFGSYWEKVLLPEVYELEMKSYIDSTQKENTKAKKIVNWEDTEADPVIF